MFRQVGLSERSPSSRVQELLARRTCRLLPHKYLGTADAVYQNRHLVERHRPELVAVFAADHVYRMDVQQMAEFHHGCSADVTVAAVPVPIESASSFGVIAADMDGRIREFHEKPARPAAMSTDPTRAYASMGNYLFDPHVLVTFLDGARENGGADFGRDVMPRLARCSRSFAYDFASNRVPGVQPYEEAAYWRDVGTISALQAARRDVAGFQPRFDLRNAWWPIRSEGHGELSTKVRNAKASLVEMASS